MTFLRPRYIGLILYAFFLHSFIFAQSYDSLKITGTYDNVPLEKVLLETGKKYHLRFFTEKEWIEGLTVHTKADAVSLSEFLDLILKNTPLSYVIYDAQTVVIIKKVVPPKIDSYSLSYKKDRPRSIRKIITPNSGKRVLTLSGNIEEDNSGKPLSGSIYIEELNKTFLAGEDGKYVLTLTKGNYTITFRYLGFIEEKVKINLRSDFKVNARLSKEDFELREVVVEARGESKNVSSIQMSTANLTISEIKKMPAFLGEADVIKSIVLLPGVTTVGEGASGFNVRGGSVDQNLVLMDGAPLFNSSHFFGFFSVFNPDLVKDVTLYKGGIPAQLGGRLSSVLEANYLSGNDTKYHLKAGIGPIISKITIEGPIVKEKISFILGGRASYPNWILKQLRDLQARKSRAYFYDFSGKLTYRINSKNTLSYTGYFSEDQFNLDNDSSYRWKNQVGVLNWKHQFNANTASSVSALFSNYSFGVEYPKGPNAFVLNNGIDYKEIKGELIQTAFPHHKINTGISAGVYTISPGKLSTPTASTIIPLKVEEENALESALFLNDEITIGERLTLMTGLRLSAFYSFGKKEQYQYLSGASKEVDNIVDTVDYEKKPLFGFEPRIALSYRISVNNSIKINYNRIRQYIHLITNTTAVTPLDIWKVSDRYTGPSTADHFGLGFFKNLNDNQLEVAIEFYYKNLHDLVDYKDGAELLLNQHIETELISGKGRAYGMEWMVKKNSGKVTGWVSYGYSRTERQVKDEFPEETINFGKYFPANYDKPHDFKVVGNYQVRRRLSLAFNFNYSTGRPITAPESKYVINGVVIPNYLYRNNIRIPDYHRLDLAITYEGKNKKERKYENSITFSVYNVYGRKNPYSVFYKHEMDSAPGSYQLAVVGAPIPSITYNIRF